MKKLAIFVEGQTEAIFAEHLVLHLARKACTQIEIKKSFGGRRFPRIELSSKIVHCGDAQNLTHYILIRDCGADERVISDINDQCESLKRSGFKKILGLRDVRPVQIDKVEALRNGIKKSLKDLDDFPICISLAIMEIEAWLMAENSHFERLNAGLTKKAILDAIGFYPEPENVASREDASGDLRNIYFIVGEVYEKTETSVRRTHSLLSFESVCKNVAPGIGDLGRFVNEVRSFFE